MNFRLHSRISKRKNIEHFTQQKGELPYFHRAPKKLQERWRKWGVMPRGIDREIVEALHRTNIGVDEDPDNIMSMVAKVGLADGWGGCMISTDITDILFGTPKPVQSDRRARSSWAPVRNVGSPRRTGSTPGQSLWRRACR